ncbi:hypothetical protein SASPL_151276 [Salvia splendens]|uniref:Oligopeptide transporter n=1 Tax=Salvia splendens TaxID=180675 RepID=A0A8X8Z2I7_SALSN|nr:hypothetical protein SASPL_151276 [Salvia splendens]
MENGEKGENTEIETLSLDENDELPDDMKRIPPWKKQITIRGMIAGLFIGTIYSVVLMKLNLSIGIVPNLNVSAALLAFVFIRTWTKLLEKSNFTTTPFTRQENTVIQTCAVACYGLSYGGGFASFLLSLSRKIYEQAGVDTEGNSPTNLKEPELDWMMGFLFVVSFVGLVALVPLRKMIIIDYKLPYPSGTATALLINGFHTPKGDKMAKKQVRGFVKFSSFSFVWSFFQWFYSGGEHCRFANFPTFGLRAWKQTFFFDFCMTYVGAGMICSYLVNVSLLLGAVLSWDRTVMTESDDKDQSAADVRRNEVYKRESIPLWVSCSGIFLSVFSVIIIPIMFPQLKWYHIAIVYVFAPSLSFCNAYETGLTDMNMSFNYGKVALFVLAALGGEENGVVAGLIGCGLVKSMVSISSDLMQDMKTGHLTLTSPRAMLLSQAVGTAIGCVVAPLTFFIFYKAFDVGSPNSTYKAPYALQGALRAHISKHGDSWRGGLLLSASPLLAAVLRVFWVRRVGKPGEGRGTGAAREIRASPDGHGGAVPRWGVVCHRHVYRELGGVCLE